MCGIAGFVTRETLRDPSAVLREMSNSIIHRGPDDSGYFESRIDPEGWWLGLGFRRLSIIDLHTGHQPMHSADGNQVTIFNGEIYNFQEIREELLRKGCQFQTKSDTEVILNSYKVWGRACVERFRGMFAFAIWDATKKRLFIARDRYGKKPLFLYSTPDSLVFASEIKCILQWPDFNKRVNLAALDDYFRYRYAPGPATLFENITKLPPGHTLTWQAGKFTSQRYFTPPDRAPFVSQGAPHDPLAGFRGHLEEAVRLRMISDVPFGAFLSGGIDSSLIVAMMAKISQHPVKTFSVGFSESSYSELSYAKQVADAFSTDHHELEVSQDQLMDYLPALTRFRDAPVAEPSDIPIYLLAKEASRHVKMVLTGEGSDEVLAGYPKHRFERYVRPYQWIPQAVRRGLIEPLIMALPYRFRRAKTAIRNMGLEHTQDRWPGWFGAMTPAQHQKLVNARNAAVDGGDAVQFDVAASNSALRNILYFDQTSWLPDNLLERGDRMTMAASIEARMPFMDHVFMEFVSKLPDEYRLRGSQQKWILRRVAEQIIPADIINRPKVGFRVPVNEWFQTTMRDYITDLLTSANSATRDYYDAATLTKILQEHTSGRQNHEKLLWTLVTLEVWHREYMVAA